MKEETGLVEMINKGRLNNVLRKLLGTDVRMYKDILEQRLESVNILYLASEKKDKCVFRGEYKLWSDLYKYLIGREYANSLHRRIRQDIVDCQTKVRFG